MRYFIPGIVSAMLVLAACTAVSQTPTQPTSPTVPATEQATGIAVTTPVLEGASTPGPTSDQVLVPTSAPAAQVATATPTQVTQSNDIPTPTATGVREVVPTPAPAATLSPTQTPQPATPAGASLEVRLDWSGLTQLFSGQGLDIQPVLGQISVLNLDGTELETRGGGASHSFDLPPGAAYLINAETIDGVNLWALTPKLMDGSSQVVSLQSTYQAGLVYAAQAPGTISADSVNGLKDMARTALDMGTDRLVNTVKRVVDNAVLWRAGYSVTTELNPVNLRSFGGGLDPVRSMNSLLSSPEPDYVPHIYMLNVSNQDIFFLDRIFMSEMKADRWTVILAAEDVPPRIYGGLGGVHMVHGGSTIVYGEDNCFQWNGSDCQIFRQVIVTRPLEASADSPALQLTSTDDFDGAHRPQWSWDENRIAFHAFPDGRLAPAQIYLINKDGTGLEQLTSHTDGQNGARMPSWSPDNSQIAFGSDAESFSWDIWVMDSDGSRLQNLTKGRVKFPNEPRFSPDGRHILFYGHDDMSNSSGRGAPDYELWVMDQDGSNLRKITDNESNDKTPVWGLNGVDVIYTVDDENWEVANVFTAQRLFQFPGVSYGKYQSAVLAATQHVLVPSQAAIDAEVVTERGYVQDDWLKTRLEARVETGGEVRIESVNRTGGYQVVTPSSDPLSGIRYEIYTAFTQTPIYQSDIGGWIPPIISWP